MTVYDNHYTQAITPIIFTSSSSYTILTDNPIPVYGEKGSDTKVKFEITDYLEDSKLRNESYTSLSLDSLNLENKTEEDFDLFSTFDDIMSSFG